MTIVCLMMTNIEPIAHRTVSARELENSFSGLPNDLDRSRPLRVGQINELESFARSLIGSDNRTFEQSESSLIESKHRPTCQMVHVAHLLHHIGCQPKAIASFACKGTCSSYVQVSYAKRVVNLL